MPVPLVLSLASFLSSQFQSPPLTYTPSLQMASHHHHYENSIPSSCCCCCSRTPSFQFPTSDPLLQTIATHLLHSSQTHLSPQYLQKQQQKHQEQQQKQTQSLLSSLLHRIDALESSLRHLSASPPPLPSYSLRHIAARIIQTHFRAFLVRRSCTLRQLKYLAFIKSTLNRLKSSISDETHLNAEALSQKSMHLLLRLDSIQGDDPMIRDGKRSISRELVQFLEFVNGIFVKRRELSTKAMKTMRIAETHDPYLRRREVVKYGKGTNCRDLGGDQRAFMENFSDQVQDIRGFSKDSESDEEAHVELEGFLSQVQNGVLLSSKPKKSLSFAENGNVSRVFISTHEPFPRADITSIDQQVSDDDRREFIEKICREVEEIGIFSAVSEDDEEAHMENEGSPQISDGERNPRKNVKAKVNYEISRHCQGQNGNFLFSAPLPVQMEPRRTEMMKKKIMRVVR